MRKSYPVLLDYGGFFSLQERQPFFICFAELMQHSGMNYSNGLADL